MLRWAFYVSGLILILIGIAALMNPYMTVVASAAFLGCALILAGVNELYTWIAIRNLPNRPIWLPLLGVVDILAGMLFLSRIGLAIFTLLTLFAAWVLFSGMIRIYVAYRLKWEGVGSWWVMFLGGILMVLTGLLLAFNPFATALSIVAIAGFALAGIGLLTVLQGRSFYPPLYEVDAAMDVRHYY